MQIPNPFPIETYLRPPRTYSIADTGVRNRINPSITVQVDADSRFPNKAVAVPIKVEVVLGQGFAGVRGGAA